MQFIKQRPFDSRPLFSIAKMKVSAVNKRTANNKQEKPVTSHDNFFFLKRGCKIIKNTTDSKTVLENTRKYVQFYILINVVTDSENY